MASKLKPRTFKLIRYGDSSGVSGTGHVLDGVIFPNGTTVVQWIGKITSVTIYQTVADFWRIHCASHPLNKSELHFYDNGDIVDEMSQIVML